MIEQLAAPIVVCVAALGFMLNQADFDAWERQLLWAAFAAHIAAAVAQVWLTTDVYGGGDMFLYSRAGTMLARWIAIDPEAAWRETLNLFFQVPAHFPFPVIGEGSSTGTMSALSAMLQVMLGPSIYASCFVMAALSFAGKVALYRCFREVFPPNTRRWLPLAVTAIPSLVYWSSGLLKESLAVAGLGLLMLGALRTRRARFVLGPAMIAVGIVLVALSKPYILFALLPTALVWVYWERALVRSGGKSIEIRPVVLVAGTAAAWGGIVLLGELFPRYSLDALPDEASRLQGLGHVIAGGSNYNLSARPSDTLAGQFVYAPFALLTALFRPFFFEARNVPMLVGAIETTAVALVLGRAIAVRRLSTLWTEMRASPALMMSVVFVVVFGTAVGLSSTNLGTLSRYRVPMLPFLAATLLSLSAGALRPEPTHVAASSEPLAAPPRSSRAARLRARGAKA